jgi:hypothetical protein
MGLNSTPLEHPGEYAAAAGSAGTGAAPEGDHTGVELGRAGGRLGCARAEDRGRRKGEGAASGVFPSPSDWDSDTTNRCLGPLSVTQ